MLCAGAVALSAVDARSPNLVVTTGGMAVGAFLAFVGVVVLPAPAWLGPAIGFIGVLFVLRVLLLGSLDVVGAGLAGLGLLAAGELAQWSLDARHAGRYDGPVHRSRALGIASLVLRGAAVVVVGGIAAVLPLSGGLELVLLAAGAAVALFGLTAFVVPRAR